MKKLKHALSFRDWRKMKIDQFEKEKKRYFENGKRDNHLLKFKDIGRGGFHLYLREDWEIFEQKNMNGKKAFIIEKLRMIKRSDKSHHSGGAHQGNVEYRIGYFIVTPKNRWWWGESCPFVPESDMPNMIAALRRLS